MLNPTPEQVAVLALAGGPPDRRTAREAAADAVVVDSARRGGRLPTIATPELARALRGLVGPGGPAGGRPRAGD
jgi:hypothetical protein